MHQQLTTSTLAIIVLAAGRSSRMGAHKLLLPLDDRPVIAHVVDAALATPLRPVVVVLGHDAARVRDALPAPPHGPHVVVNPDYASGLSSSLHAGVEALPPQTAGAIIMLGDQPLVRPKHLMRLAAAAEASRALIAVATYGGLRGNPVYFARAYFPALCAVTGDEGGRAVVARHTQDVVAVEMGDEAAAMDVDVPEDYEHVRTLWAQRHSHDAT